MTRILVTGATGFVGSHIYALLREDGHDLFGTTKSHPSPTIAHCDIEDYDSVRSLIENIAPDAIVHCAAISSVTSSPSYDYYKSNVIGTENILKAVSNIKKKTRLLFTSTAGVYGNQDSESYSEDLCPKPIHHYGLSKFCCERLLYNYIEYVDFTIVRPFNIIGEGQTSDFIVPKLAQAFAERKQEVRLGNIDVYRDYIDVHEAVNIIRFLLFSDKTSGQTYNLCSGIPVSLKELISLFRQFSEHDIEIEIATEFVRKNEVWRLTGDATKLKALIGNAVSAIPIEQSIQRILAAYEAKLG